MDSGGGFNFELVRCDKCGKTKSITFEKLDKLRQKYRQRVLKSLQGPFPIATPEHDEEVRRQALAGAKSGFDSNREINMVAGKCRCGGKFSLDAPPRCPKCHSTRIENNNNSVTLYD